jgi:large subunit ribosomal protein L15
MSDVSIVEKTLKPAPGSTKKRIRVGRGDSSGHGGESGRGHKGQKSRTGYSRRTGFEGGQNPLYRRLPKRRGLGNPANGRVYATVNLEVIEQFFSDGDIVDLGSLISRKLVKKYAHLKVLGNGEITKALTIKAHAISKSAQEKIASTKSQFELV